MTGLMVAGYFALRVADFGESFWLHAMPLALLAIVGLRLADIRKDA